MSVVVAIKKDKVVYVGADSQATCGGTKVSLNNPNNYKIWSVKGIDNCLMGAVGDLRDACVIRTIDGLVDRLDAIDGLVDYDYVVNVVEPLIREALHAHKFLPDEDPYSALGSVFLFVYQDKIYTIVGGAVIEHDDYVAIGSGSSEAMGSLNSTEFEEDPNMRIIKAIKASEGHDLYVGYPIILSNSIDSNKFVIVDEKLTKKIVAPAKPKGKRHKEIKEETKEKTTDQEPVKKKPGKKNKSNSVPSEADPEE